MSTPEAATAPQDSAAALGDQQNFISGEWRDPSNGRRLPVINPATEEQIATIPDSGADDVDAAVKAADAAFAEGEGPWAMTPVPERLAACNRVLDALAAKAEQIGGLEAMDGGFTIRNAVGFHAMGAPEFTRAQIALVPTDVPQGLPLAEEPTLSANYMRREPIGVIAAMPASNGGFFMSLYKSLCALVCGNSVVLKPSPLCSLSAAEIAKAIEAEEAIPADVFHLVHGDAEAGSSLTAHPQVGKISFTGSIATAQRIMAAAAPNLSKLTLELGGKGLSVVLDDANLDRTIDGIVWGIMWQTGQACIAGSRLLVPEALHDEIIDRLKARIGTIVVGDPMDPNTDLGPVVSEAARDRIEGFIASAKDAGARVVVGGERPDFDKGYWVSPTILDGVTNDMDVARNEIFGPVLAVMTYSDVDEAVRIANDTEYGLAATVWAGSYTRGMAVAKRLRAGTVWINEHHMFHPSAAFGGYKKSGVGREFGPHGIEAFTELKHIHVDLSRDDGNPAWGILLAH